MNEPFNPYQAPASDLIPKTSNEDASFPYSSEGKYLVMPMGQSVLPHRCTHCNAQIDGLIKKRTLYWHHPALYLLLLLSIFIHIFGALIYCLVALILRKKILIQSGLCAKHDNKRVKLIYLSLSIFCPSIFLLFITTTKVANTGLLFGIGTIALLVWLLVGLILYTNSKALTIKKIQGNLVYFSNCGHPFLDSFRQSNHSQ